MKYIAKELPKSFALKTGKVKRGLSRLSATRMPRQGQADAVWFGRFHAGPVVIPCALGRTGITRDKREGDHATPAGAFRLLSGFFRVDRGGASPLARADAADQALRRLVRRSFKRGLQPLGPFAERGPARETLACGRSLRSGFCARFQHPAAP